MSIRLSEEQKAWLKEESEARGCSEAEILRDLVDDARGAATNETIVERLERLEKQVEEMNVTASHRTGDDERHRASPPVTESGHRSSPDVTGDIDSVAAEVDLPGSGDELERRQEVFADLLRWAREQETWQKSDVMDRWLTDDRREAVGYGSDNARWYKLFQRGLKDCDLVELDNRTWRWVGAD